MAFIIDRNVLNAINRRTAEHLRSLHENIKNSTSNAAPGTSYSPTEITNSQTAHISGDDIRAALMLAKKRITPDADPERVEDLKKD